MSSWNSAGEVAASFEIWLQGNSLTIIKDIVSKYTPICNHAEREATFWLVFVIFWIGDNSISPVWNKSSYLDNLESRGE